MSYKIIRYQPEYKQQWDDFVRTAKNATFLFYRDFMEYHSDRFEDYSLMVFKDDKLVSILPANRKGNAIYSHQGLTYGGVIIRSQLKLSNYIELFQHVLQFLEKNQISHFEIKLLPSFFASLASEEINYVLFCLNASCFRCDTFAVIDLQKPFHFSKDRKEGIKRGIKNNLEVREETDLFPFWENLLIPVLEEKHDALPVHSAAEIQLLKEKFPAQIRQFNVYKNDNLVTGTTIFETSQVAHSQYIAANSDKNNNGSLDFLHNHLIKNVFQKKAFFDFGTFNLDAGTKINTGLGYSKQSFGAQIYAQNFYRIETKNHHKLNDVCQ